MLLITVTGMTLLNCAVREQVEIERQFSVEIRSSPMMV